MEVLPTDYPLWGEALSVTLMLLSIVFIPIVALMVKTGVFKLKALTSAEDDELKNGPVLPSASTQPLNAYEMQPDQIVASE